MLLTIFLAFVFFIVIVLACFGYAKAGLETGNSKTNIRRAIRTGRSVGDWAGKMGSGSSSESASD